MSNNQIIIIILIVKIYKLYKNKIKLKKKPQKNKQFKI